MSGFTHYRVKNDEQTAIIQGTEEEISGFFLEKLESKLNINILSLSEDSIVFDLIGVDASIANAVRRALLAEVDHIFKYILLCCLHYY